MNRVCLMGRLTAAPELRQTASGISSCSFNIAVDRGFKDQNGDRQTDFIGCTAWRQTAEFIGRYFSKGKMIGIEGALRTRNYDDKRYPDVKHYVTEVLVDHAYFGGDSGGSKSSSPPQRNNTAAAAPAPVPADLSDFEEVVSDSDLPF
nr:MAG TPA: Single strand binding protein [Caudoviricetes sp.]